MEMRLWTDEEVNFLKNNFDNMSTKELAKQLNRNYNSVGYKLHSLRLKRTKKFIKCSEDSCDRKFRTSFNGRKYCARCALRQYRLTEKGKAVMLESSRKHRKTSLGRYTYIKHDAKRRNIHFDLTKKQYAELIKDKKCHYNCGSEISDTCAGLDRLDSSKGYTLSNVVPCCRSCNTMKNNILTEKEVFEIVKLLKKIRNKRDIWE